MSQIINKYNNCFSYDTVYEVIPDTSEDKLQLDFVLLAGASLTTLEFNTGQYLLEDLEDVDFGYSLKPTFGIALNIVFPKNLKRWSIYNEFRYHSYKLQGEGEKQYSSFNNEYYYEFDYAYIKYSLMMRYMILLDEIQPFFNVGIVNSWAVKTNDTRTTTTYRYSSTSQTEKNVFDDPRKFEQGFLFGVGIYYGRFSGEFRFELANGMSNYQRLNSKTYSYLFMLGFTF